MATLLRDEERRTNNGVLTPAATEPRTANRELKTSMPYDPNYPPQDAEIESAPLRVQFQGLKTLIDAVPTVTTAVVDAVNTLPAGDPAEVSVSVTGGVLHLSFGIPMGQSGPPGEVSLADMNAAIATTSSNSNAVTMLSQVADAEYSQTQMQSLFTKVDELLMALRRS